MQGEMLYVNICPTFVCFASYLTPDKAFEVSDGMLTVSVDLGCSSKELSHPLLCLHHYQFIPYWNPTAFAVSTVTRFKPQSSSIPDVFFELGGFGNC